MTDAGDATPTWSNAANITATTRGASSGTPTNGGAYNWGDSDDTSDRAIGFMTSGGYASPNSIMAYFQNNTGNTINTLSLSFDIERYRLNTSNASVSLFTSTDGTNWTAQSAGDIAPATFGTGASAYDFTVSGASFTSVFPQSVTLSSLGITNGSGFYLRWSMATGAANSQGLGLDNFSISSVPEPATYGAAAGLAALAWAVVRRRRGLPSDLLKRPSIRADR
jgi:MYXO-CTERM domain-containing protein